jgi:2-C-methyl-D-erythritol 4-phosphate cytidylyltransferase
VSLKASAIVVAAGSGIRLGLTIPKAFVIIDNASLLLRVLRTIAEVKVLDEVVLAVPTGEQSRARAEVQTAGVQIPVKIIVGGAERQDSVRLALRLTSAEAEVVVVHDAARPFATPAMFSECIAAAGQDGGAVVAVPVADTLKKVEHGIIVATVPRDGLWQAQTPQAFGRELLISAHEWALRERINATDDAELCQGLGVNLQIVRGSPANLKITTAEDLRISEAIARLSCSLPDSTAG